jgi:proteasome lid subunit RPN8/RPN11
MALGVFKAHAEREYPREACGLLLNDEGVERYFACRNIADDPTKDFVLDPRDWLTAERFGRVVAVCHSHPDAPAEPSGADSAACLASALPWFILSHPGGGLKRIEPVAPLKEREFIYGKFDCYSLLRDYYKLHLKIDLPDFEREGYWWKDGRSRYEEGFASVGFERVEDLRVHDVLLMKVRSPVPNHVAVYLGEGRMLHHLLGQLSREEAYLGYWVQQTTHVLRHKACR